METQFDIKELWRKNRKRYNIALVIAGFLGFISYCFIGSLVVSAPYFEATIFTTFFQGIIYLIMMAFANIGYTLFMHIDDFFNKSNLNTLGHKLILLYLLGNIMFPPFLYLNPIIFFIP